MLSGRVIVSELSVYTVRELGLFWFRNGKRNETWPKEFEQCSMKPSSPEVVSPSFRRVGSDRVEKNRAAKHILPGWSPSLLALRESATLNRRVARKGRWGRSAEAVHDYAVVRCHPCRASNVLLRLNERVRDRPIDEAARGLTSEAVGPSERERNIGRRSSATTPSSTAAPKAAAAVKVLFLSIDKQHHQRH